MAWPARQAEAGVRPLPVLSLKKEELKSVFVVLSNFLLDLVFGEIEFLILWRLQLHRLNAQLTGG